MATRKKKVSKKKTARRKSSRRAASDLLGKIGRPTLYRPEYCEQLVAFFTVEPTKTVTRTTVSKKSGEPVSYEVEVPNTLPTLQAFAANIGVTTVTMRSWAKAHPDFGEAVARAKELAENHLVQNGLAGHYNPGFCIFVAKNYTPMRDVTVHENEEKAAPRTGQEIEQRIHELNETIETLRGQL
jgi:hypothetical protein